MKQIKNRKEWEEHIASYRSSGQSARVWCKNNGLNVSTLKYWITKINKDNVNLTASTGNWAKVEISEPEKKNKKSDLIITIGKASIIVNSDFDSKLLSDIVRALSILC